MKNNHYSKGNPQLRQLLIRESARLMYEENITQYHTAKWRAAKNILSRGGAKFGKIRNCDLPSNGEISLATHKLAQLYEGEKMEEKLLAMRMLALEVMARLTAFSPGLIGSVNSGRIKNSSDIDIHVFTDSIESLEYRLEDSGWPYERKSVAINDNNKIKYYTHIYLNLFFLVELSVYPENHIRVRGRSSTDGKPIERMSYKKLCALIMSTQSF